jgi:AraC family transcriptional regulator
LHSGGRCPPFPGSQDECVKGEAASQLRRRAGNDALPPIVEIWPPDMAKRCIAAWTGMAAETVESTGRGRIECRFRAPVHLLVMYEQGERRGSETFVGDLPRSRRQNVERRFTFVPADHEYHEWLEPRTLARLTYFYFDPATLQILSDRSIAENLLTPRLLFEDASLWSTAIKLKISIDAPAVDDCNYVEALGLVLAHELARLDREAPSATPPIRGGLAAWQQRKVTSYIEEHLAEQIPLLTLARLAKLSPYHFSRVFKKSFGVSPHRYHVARRIARAKELLTQRTSSVTEIGLKLGFSETSAFSAAFRRETGLTPSRYYRSAP